MAEKYKEIDNINKIRQNISRITEHISCEKSLFAIMRENPALSGIILFVFIILTIFISKKVIKTIASLISAGLKIMMFFYLFRRFISFVPMIKNMKTDFFCNFKKI